MSRNLGDAFISITPNFVNFTRDLRAKLKAEMVGVEASVKIKADLDAKSLDAAIAKQRIVVDALQKQMKDLRFVADNKAAVAKIDDLALRVDKLMRKLAKMPAGIEATAARSQIASLIAQSDLLKDNLKDMPANIKLDQAKLEAEEKLAAAKLDILTRDRDVKIKLDVDSKTLKSVTQMAGADAAAGFLTRLLSLGGKGGGGKSGGGGGGGGSAGVRALLPGGQNAGAVLENPSVLGPVASLTAVALPFIAQQLGSLLIGALGTALAGIGVAGALKSQLPASVTTAQTTFQGAAANAATAGKNPANAGAFAATLTGPFGASAKLLENQGTAWQNLTAKQQAGLISLRNNSGAYKALLPAQQQALNALLKEQVAWNGLTPAQQKAARATAGMSSSLQTLQTDASNALVKMGTSFVPVLTSIFNTADTILNKMTPVFAGAIKTISGPFKIFADALITAFGSPAVQRSIQAVAGAFAKMLTALTPGIATDVGDIAEGITNIANAVAKNPQAFANFVGFLFKIGEFALNAIAWLTEVAAWIENHWSGADGIGTLLAVPFKFGLTEIKLIIDIIVGVLKIFVDVLTGNWGAAWRALEDMGKKIWHDITKEVVNLWDSLVPRKLRHDIANVFDGIRHDIAHAWDLIYSNGQRMLQSIHNGIILIFDKVRHDVAGAWDNIYRDTIGKIVGIAKAVPGKFDSMRHGLATIFDAIRHDIAHIWDIIYNNTIGAVIRLAKDAINGIKRLSDWINGTLGPFVLSFFTKTIPHIFDLAVNFAKTHLVDPVINTIKRWSDWINNNLGPFILSFFTKTIPHIFDLAVNFAKTHLVDPIINAIKRWSDWINNNLGPFILSFFTRTIPHIFDLVVGFAKTHLVDPIINAIKRWSDWLNNNLGPFISNFFTRTIPHIFDLVVGFANTHFVTPIEKAFQGTLNWLHRTFFTDVSNLFTKTIPHAFDVAVSAIGKSWSKVEGVIKGPLHIVASPIATLFKGIDAVTSFVGLGNPLAGAVKFLGGLRTGGKLAGFGGGDSMLAMLEPGEAVVDKFRTKQYAPLLKKMGVPGFAGGGYVDPIPRGVRPERIDMGVDFAGAGNILAIGNGTIIETHGSGWPGGPFMSYRLDDGAYTGRNVYVAENIQPSVVPLEHVKAGQVIAKMFNGGTGIETGWADSSGFSPLSQSKAAGSISGANLPGGGSDPTAVGKAFDELLISLGAPAAPNFNNPVGGKLPPAGAYLGPPVSGGSFPGGGIIRTIVQIFSSLGKWASAAIDLAHGDTAGALRALLGDVKQTAGGAKGLFGTTLLDIPSVLTKDIIKKILSAVKSFTAAQQQPTGPSGAPGPAGVGSSAGEIANGTQIYKYLLANLFGGNKIAAAGAIASIWGESTWNPFAQDCVPLDYKVVTTRGILAHDEVRVGDFTPVYNPATGKVEDAEILDIPYHDAAPICIVGNQQWSVICTVDHKWLNADGQLVRAYDMKPGVDKIMVGDGRLEAVDFFQWIGLDDTFCLTTTTGTWTCYRDEKVAAEEMTEPGPFWTGNSSGRGLIGWTPKSTISNADFSGGMRTQLPAILRFVTSSGDSGVIAEMFRATSVLQAANEWGRGVERFGINDVHSAGLSLAKQIAGLRLGGLIGPSFDQGGILRPGGNYVWNGTGRPEPLVPANGDGGRNLSAGERAILSELKAIRHATQNAPVTFGRAISGSLVRGAGRGYYGS